MAELSPTAVALSRKQLFSLHNTIGLASAALVLVSALTGIALTFRASLRPDTPPAAVVATHLPLETLVAKAEAAADGHARVTRIQLPRAPTAAYRIRLDDEAATEVLLDGAGTVLGTRARKRGFAQMLFLIHTGELLGWFGQMLMVLSALSLCLLAWTGLSMWRTRRRKAPRLAT